MQILLSPEEYLMCHMFTDSICVSVALKKIDHTFFSEKYSDFMGWAIQYYKAYGSMPNADVAISQFSNDPSKATMYDDWCREWSKESLLQNSNGFQYFLKLVIDDKLAKELNNVMGECSRIIQSDVANTSSIKTENRKVIEKQLNKFIYTSNALGAIDRVIDLNLKSNINNRRLDYEKLRNSSEDQVRNKFISFGIDMLDQKITNMSSGMIMVGGATGDGKSTLIMNMAINAWKGRPDRNRPPMGILYISVELPAEELEHRFYCALAKVNSARLKMGRLNDNEWTSYQGALTAVENNPKVFYIEDLPRNVTMNEIEDTYERISAEYEIDLIVVDYIGLMKTSNSNLKLQDWQELDHIARDMHEFTKLHRKVVLTASQLTRLKDDKNYYSGDRFARSKGIVDNSDVVLQIGQFNAESDFNRMDVMIIKNRYGVAHEMLGLYRDFSQFYVGNELETSFFGGSVVNCDPLNPTPPPNPTNNDPVQ